MFDHRNFALLGLYPGLVSTFSVAGLGQLEITLTPIEPEFQPGLGGGGYYGPRISSPTKYLLKIRITRKGKTWESQSTISSTFAKVLAKFIGRELPSVSVSQHQVITKEQPGIEIKHVSTTKIGRSG